MPKKTGSYKSWLQQKLTDPVIAANYLNAAMKDSPELFLVALRNVSAANVGIAKVAEKTQLSRESLYRSFSEKGNPEWNTLTSVLSAIGLELVVQPKIEAANTPPLFQPQQSAAEVVRQEVPPSRGVLAALTQQYSRIRRQAISTQELAYADH